MERLSWEHLPSTLLFRDYLYRFERLQAWFPCAPFDPEGHRRQFERRWEFFQRQSHARTWPAWLRPWQGDRTLDLTPTTGLVITGQQAGLLGGPLFTVYKIATAFRLAKEWTERGLSMQAAFWSLDEDHDLKECLTVASIDQRFHPVRAPLSDEVQDNRRPLGTITVDDPLVVPVLQFHRAYTHAGLYRDSVEAAWSVYDHPGRPLPEAFRLYLITLGFYPPMAWISSHQVDLKRAALPVLVRLVERWAEWFEAWQVWMRNLEVRGYHRQVRIHGGYFPLFRLAEGQRHRLLWQGGVIACPGTGERWTPAGFIRWLQDHVADVSPNVILRPIVQDFVFPTMIYVAGASEVAYWAQIRFFYERLEIPMPVVFPRMSLTLAPPQLRRHLRKTGLTVVECLARPPETWHPPQVERPSWWRRVEQVDHTVETWMEEIRRHMQEERWASAPRVERALRHLQTALERLKMALDQAWLEHSQRWQRTRKTIASWVCPFQTLQERAFHPAVFFQLVGSALWDVIFDQAELWTPDHQILDLH